MLVGEDKVEKVEDIRTTLSHKPSGSPLNFDRISENTPALQRCSRRAASRVVALSASLTPSASTLLSCWKVTSTDVL